MLSQVFFYSFNFNRLPKLCAFFAQKMSTMMNILCLWGAFVFVAKSRLSEGVIRKGGSHLKLITLDFSTPFQLFKL